MFEQQFKTFWAILQNSKIDFEESLKDELENAYLKSFPNIHQQFEIFLEDIDKSNMDWDSFKFQLKNAYLKSFPTLQQQFEIFLENIYDSHMNYESVTEELKSAYFKSFENSMEKIHVHY